MIVPNNFKNKPKKVQFFFKKSIFLPVGGASWVGGLSQAGSLPELGMLRSKGFHRMGVASGSEADGWVGGWAKLGGN